MVKHNNGNAPLTGTYTDNECGFVPDQKPKMEKDEIRVTLSTKEARIILALIDDFCQSTRGAIAILKHFEIKGILDQIEKKINKPLTKKKR